MSDPIYVTALDLAGVLGSEAAETLCAEAGGRRVYVPAVPEAADPIARAVGIVAARDLASVWGAQQIELPSLASARRTLRNACIRRAYTGANADELAARHGLTRRQIFNILKTEA